ncbi:caspase domain-containing protein [Rhizoctonia solani]|nr:caspase domain-containing protein [Rhizoctonia solani]
MHPHSPNRAPVTLRIDVPNPDSYSASYSVQQPPISPYTYYSSQYPQMPGWNFLSPTYSPGLNLPPPSPEVTRNILQASSSYDVQWHRENSFVEYDSHTRRRDPIPPRQYANSPNSPLFPPVTHGAMYLPEEEDAAEDFEPDTARSVSPEPFSHPDSHVSECSLNGDGSFNGRRQALIIVLEYRAGQEWEGTLGLMAMQGSYKDGEDIYRLLLEQGYYEHEITVMKDSPDTPIELQPTCENIKHQLGRLVAGAAPGDRFFLYYAGHGIQVKDTNGDEADELDEAIISSDWTTTYNYSDEGLVIDDYLKQVCVDPLPKGANLTAVFDCCHSGTIMDLTYEHCAKRSGLDFELNESTGLSSRRLPSRYRSVDGHVVCISACEDSQKAYAHQRGLVTDAFTKCIREFAQSYRPTTQINPTLKELYEYLLLYGRPNPESKYTQDPMLATTFKLSVDEYSRRPLLI